MIIYIGMTIISLLFMYFAEKKYVPSKRKKWYLVPEWKVYFFFSMLPSLFVAGFRYNVGTDYIGYLRMDHYIGSVFAGHPRSMEPIYRILVEIGYRLNSTQVVFFLNALIFSIFAFAFIKQFSKNWCLSIILLLITGTFSQSLNIMRQMAAAMICLYALKYAVKKQFVKYLIFILFAAGIHTTAIIFIVPYFFIDKIHFSKTKGKAIIVVSALALYVLSPWIYRVVEIILTLLGSKYALYYGSVRDIDANFAILLISLISLVFVFALMKDDTNGNNVLLLYAVLACAVLVMHLPNCNRLTYLFLPAHIALIPNCIQTVSGKIKRNIITFIILGMYFIFWIYLFYDQNVSATFPYQSIFSK